MMRLLRRRLRLWEAVMGYELIDHCASPGTCLLVDVEQATRQPSSIRRAARAFHMPDYRRSLACLGSSDRVRNTQAIEAPYASSGENGEFATCHKPTEHYRRLSASPGWIPRSLDSRI
jgi:hypothetical protein